MTLIEQIKICCPDAKNIIIRDLNLKSSGANLQCPWPDHTDNHPSAYWVNDHNLIKCPVCDKSYDIINHYQIHFGYSPCQSVFELCKELGIDASSYKPPENYIQVKKFKSPSDVFLNHSSKNQPIKQLPIEASFFKDKHIRADVAKDFFDTEATNTEILLNHHERDQSGTWQICHSKRRMIATDTFDDGSKEKCIPGGNSCFFGLKTLFKSDGMSRKIAFLCEGHTDALRLASEIVADIEDSKNDYQLGEYAVLAVPNGATSLKVALENSPTFSKWFRSSCEQLIIIPDADNAGLKMLEQVKLYLDNDKKVKWVDLTIVPGIKFKKTKGDDLSDAINILGDQYWPLLINPQFLPIDEKVNDINSVMADGFRTGIPTIDYNDTGLKTGRVTFLAGIRGSGKTTFMRQILLNIANQKIQIYVFFGEGSNENHKRDLQLAISNKNERIPHTHLDGDGQQLWYPTKEAQDRYKIKYDRYIDISDKIKSKDETVFNALLKKMIRYAERGTKVFFIDNMMQITNTRDAKNVFIEQKRVVTDLVNFANHYDVHVMIVCHLNKAGDSITGAQEQENLVDTILLFKRIDDDNTKFKDSIISKTRINEYEYQSVTSIIRVLKIRDRGEYNLCLLTWDKERGKAIELVWNTKLNRIATHYLDCGFDCIKASPIFEMQRENSDLAHQNRDPNVNRFAKETLDTEYLDVDEYDDYYNKN